MADVKPNVKRTSSTKQLKRMNSLSQRTPSAGKKPLPEPTTLKNVFLMIILQICRKIVLFETDIKIPVYLGALLCGSLVSDFTPLPRSYFSRKNNIFNSYFVKWGWAWTLVSVGIYLGLTSYVYCCGNKDRIKRHLYRLVIGTVMWFSWTKLFVLIEYYTQTCMSPKYTTKTSCLLNGSMWTGFDISGHAFLLIYCSLTITEEAMSIKGWERIGELIRYQEYDDESPLKQLSEVELSNLKESYKTFTPYVRGAFVFLTFLCILWDVMLVSTIMYFHSMVQKVVGGAIAILVWYFTYKWWYTKSASPGMPGDGCFKYRDQQPITRRTCAHGIAQ